MGEEEVLWHYWVGDARRGDTLETGVLCFAQDREKYLRWAEIKPVSVMTIIKGDVTCPDCLELIHS